MDPKQLHYSNKLIARHFWQDARIAKGWLFTMFAMVPIYSAMWFAIQFQFRTVVNIISEHHIATPAMYQEMRWVIITLCILFLVQEFPRRLRDYAHTRFDTTTQTQIANRIFTYLHGHSASFFSNTFAGSLVKQISRYIGAFESMIRQLLFFASSFLLEFVGTVAVFFWVHPLFGATILTWGIIYMGIIVVLQRYKSPYNIRETVTSSTTAGYLADTLTNALTIKTSGSWRQEARSYSKVIDTWIHSKYRARMMDLFQNYIQAVLWVVFISTFLFIVLHLWSQSLVTPGDLTLLLSLMFGITLRLWDLGEQLQRWYHQGSQALELIRIMETPHEIRDRHKARTLKVTQGAIHFDKVTFRYPDGHTVLDQFSLSVTPGEKVALVGHSGAGKSTITKLLLRLHDIQEGSISIDGQDITAVSQESLRQALTYVPQEPILFHRSLKENITYNQPRATQTQIEHAAKMAHAHPFIIRTPQGYLTMVGERGVKLSGGERQRVAIARAMLKGSSVLILDEATSSLDSESEAHIQQALHNLMKGKTVLVIAHRLSTIMAMDRIVVMDEGRILEQGSHHELLKAKGAYASLWNIQSGGFLA